MTGPDAGRSFTKADTMRLLRGRRNWGRWGDGDELGTLNLITPQKRLEAASLVHTGTSVSLSRPLLEPPTRPGARKPAMYYMDREPRTGGGGWSNDFIGLPIHGTHFTHIDALSHNWDDDGMYNGRLPDEVITFKGASAADIDAMCDGIVTRGVLVDIPRHRHADFVTQEQPVHGWELEEACNARQVEVTPGDALVVYSGREAWSRTAGYPWSTVGPPAPGNPAEGPVRPGLHASCLEFIRDHDVAVLVWDMMDMLPNDVGLPWSVHGAIFAFGTTLVDNALLEPLATACAEAGRYEFMFVASPLRLPGATGSPTNPIAIL